MSENALSELFRHQSYYLTLPSGGKYYTQRPKLSVDGEVGVMPMTAADEIKLKSPDALFNGEGLYELFKSCVPSIPEPKEIPAIDMDALLIAIRLAGGEENLELNSKCPECGETSPYQINLNELLRSIRPRSFDNVLQLRDDVEVVLHPITLASQIKTQIETFYQLQMQQALARASEDIETNKEIFEKALASAIALQVGQVADCIRRVTISKDESETVVEDVKQIEEWVKNMTKKDHKAISDRIKLISSVDKNEDIPLTCPHCGHEYRNKVELNPANFF